MHRTSFSPYEEEGLVARCLRGEDTAWEVMFRLYHPRLVSIIKAEMNWQCSTDQAEEIAASIWCSLCSETYSRLRRYDPQIGGLLTYLRALSRREIWKKTTCTLRKDQTKITLRIKSKPYKHDRSVIFVHHHCCANTACAINHDRNVSGMTVMKVIGYGKSDLM